MKIINHKILAAIVLTITLSACTMEKFFDSLIEAPAASIERNVKGHEQIYSVQAILRLAQKRPDGYAYTAYGLSNFVNPPIPIYQQIDISKDELGKIKITSERKHFDVVKSKDYCYALELRYYDLNGKLINHQFSTFDKADPEGSTLLHHQHFFTLQNYSLDGSQLVYPMTLDSLYYDEFTFKNSGTKRRIESSIISPLNAYAPVDAGNTEKVRYNFSLAQRAVEKSATKEATAIYTEPKSGIQYKLFETIIPTKLDEKVTQIFTYEYRDTDPVEDELFTKVKGLDDLGRQRVGRPVQLLQQNRDLTTEIRRDYLGFKGILKFKKTNVAFQMRICIAHMITSQEKYISPNNIKWVMHEHNQISPSWNSYDIDYPLAFRVIADVDEEPEKVINDIKRFYPQTDGQQLKKMFTKNSDWYVHFAKTTI